MTQNSSTIHYEILKSQHVEQVIEILHRVGRREGTMMSALNMQHEELDESFKNLIEKAIPQQVSILAMDGDKIIGYCINLERSDELDNNPMLVLENMTFAQRALVAVSSKITPSSALHQHVDKDSKIFFLEIIGVDSAYRRRGIAEQLVLKSIEMAKKVGCKYLTV